VKKYIFILIFITGILIIGCSTGGIPQINYYILEYYQHSENPDLKMEKPFDYSVMVQDTYIPRTYSRKQIVIRHLGPKITYSSNDFWAVNLSDIIPSLITQRLNRYNVFRQTQREFLEEKPDYEITTILNNIELSEFENFNQAHLNIDFFLQKSGEEDYLIKYSADREEKLLDDQIDTFVMKINDILFEETDNFIAMMDHYFQTGKVASATANTAIEKNKLSLYPDSEISVSGMGSLLLPSITKTDNEPYYIVYDQKGNQIASAKMGTGIPLKVGTYNIAYGSGTQNQMMMKKNVKIYPRYKTIIDPDWGCLSIDIVDENRNFVKVRYEIFEAETGESFGTDFPVDEELGEQKKIWVLKSGLYKITLNDEPYNTIKNFTTVYIEKAKYQELRIVVVTDENGSFLNLIGAGLVKESELLATHEKLKIYSAIHANMDFNSNNETDKNNPSTTITLNTQFDNRLIYDKTPLYFSSKNLMELGTTKNTDSDFRVSSDDFSLKNTFIFYFIKNLGLYSRFDTDSHLLTRYEYDAGNYIQVNVDGDTLSTVLNSQKIKIRPAFFPLVLKEGVGINLRLLNRSRFNLSLRTGFGMRQDFNKDVYSLADGTWTQGENTYNIYSEDQSKFTEGTEVSLVGNFKLPLNLSYNMNADFLFPFNKGETVSMEWENSFNLRLYKYISLDYKLKLKNKKQEDGENYIVKEHSLFLRITYILR